MSTFDNINILLIEDNPGQLGIPIKAYNTRAKSKVFNEDLECNIPTVKFSNVNGDFRQFNLKVLQHPIEIKEFIDLYADALNEFGESEIGKLDGIVPDIIVFDYAFGQNIETNRRNDGNLHYTEEYDSIRNFINPNVILQNKLKGIVSTILRLEANNSYSVNDFLTEINNLSKRNESLGKLSEAIEKSDKAILDDDQIGLFSGLSIFGLFRNHHTIAIPATHHATDISKMNLYTKYLEWLYRTDLKDVFDEDVRGQKKWDTIIPKAMVNFRERLLVLAKRNFISFDLDDLYILSTLSQDAATNELSIKVTSKYGTKNYCIDTLFIGSTENKAESIIDFAKQILKVYEITSDSFITIKEQYLKIWYTYERHFLNIYDLSEYTLKKEYLNIDLKDKQSHYEQLLTQYTQERDFIPEIKTSVFDLKNSTLEKRKMVILLITKLYIQFAKAKLRFNRGNDTNLLLEPSNEEYAYVLSPIRSEFASPYTLILESHRMQVPSYSTIGSLKTTLKKTISELWKLLGSTDDEKKKSSNDIFNFDKFSPVDKAFAKCFFIQELKSLNKKDYPKWLK